MQKLLHNLMTRIRYLCRKYSCNLMNKKNNKNNVKYHPRLNHKIIHDRLFICEVSIHSDLSRHILGVWYHHRSHDIPFSKAGELTFAGWWSTFDLENTFGVTPLLLRLRSLNLRVLLSCLGVTSDCPLARRLSISFRLSPSYSLGGQLQAVP